MLCVLDAIKLGKKKGNSKGRETIPRYWITIGKDVVWDFPGMFLSDEASPDYIDRWTVKQTYHYRDNYTWIAETIRAYIDTPREQLLTVAFENDKYGLVDVFRAVDRRIGKERRTPYIEKIMVSGE